MNIHRELRDQIRCLALDSDRMTVLDSGGLVHNVILEVADAPTNPCCGDREPVLVSLSPNQARELASSLWWLADRSERIAAGIR
ncbi:MAG TPA: hypothetical protein VEF89_03055 [Solirubrobacteraceae bacterium]|nr:hypothetical protein [Solirubrobacteraceae bacterium]